MWFASVRFGSTLSLVVLTLVFVGVRLDGPSASAQVASELPVATNQAPAPSDLRDFIEEYRADLDSVVFRYDVPMSPRRAERLRAFFESWLARLEAVDFDRLSQDGKIDYLLFKNYVTHELAELQIDAIKDADIAGLLPFAPTVIEMAEEQEDVLPVDGRQRAGDLQAMKDQVSDLKRNLSNLRRPESESPATEIDGQDQPGDDEDTGQSATSTVTYTPTQAIRASRRVNELRRALSRWYRFYEGYDPIFSWWVKAPYTEVDRELVSYAEALRSVLAGIDTNDDDKIVGEPIGHDALMNELAYEMIPYTPEELIAIAEAQFEWCDQEMLKASQELGYGDDWRAAQEAVKALHVEPGDQPAMIKGLAEEAVEFLEARDLLTIPELCKESWRMEMMSPERQRVSPYFLGGETIIVSFPTDTMSHPDKLMSMRGNNVHFSRATVQHELIPGHHLQGYMNKRHRPYRRMFRTPFWIEGWALYWEMQLWDLEFPQSPEDRIGMLFWRKHRCARIIFSLSYHLEQMTPEECIDFLVERVGHEPNNAAAEVRRSVMGGYGPLYQAAYMLGGLQIRALYRDLVETRMMTPRFFHDSILHQNAIPIEMVRARLAGIELTRDYQTSWRFED